MPGHSNWCETWFLSQFEIWYGGKANIISVLFLSQLISGLRFYDVLNFLEKM